MATSLGLSGTVSPAVNETVQKDPEARIVLHTLIVSLHSLNKTSRSLVQCTLKVQIPIRAAQERLAWLTD